MGFFVFVFVVCVIIFMVFIFMGNADHEKVQNELANSMYGEPEQDVPVIDVEKECARIEALIQASESGHDDVHQQIEDGSYTGPWPERRSDGAWTSIFDDLRILSIAGINHRQRIGSYLGRVDVALVPEPTNEFDPCAIKVVAEDGHHLGYVHYDQTPMVRAWAKDHFPKLAVAFIDEKEDETDGHKFFVGYIYLIKTKLQNEKVSNVGGSECLDSRQL